MMYKDLLTIYRAIQKFSIQLLSTWRLVENPPHTLNRFFLKVNDDLNCFINVDRMLKPEMKSTVAPHSQMFFLFLNVKLVFPNNSLLPLFLPRIRSSFIGN